jgi:hypothetical protein
MTLYLRENSPTSSAEQSSTQALKLLMTEFNSDNSSFLADGEYGVDGLRGIKYISGNPDQDSGESTATTSINVGGAAEESNNIEKKKLTLLGVSLVSIGSITLLSLFLVVATKTRRGETFETYNEFYDDDLDKAWHEEPVDDHSLNDNTMSISSNDSPKVATVYNDDFTECNTTSSILRQLHAVEAAVSPREDESIQRRPVFLSARDDESVEAKDVNLSIYTYNSSVERPSFEVMGKENRRGYVMEDTVEL